MGLCFHRRVVCSFWTCGGEGMPMNNLATAGNFFLFIEVLEKFQVVYRTFWIGYFWHVIEHLEYS